MNKWMKPAIVVCLTLSALRVSLSQEDKEGSVFDPVPRTVPRADPEGALPAGVPGSQDSFSKAPFESRDELEREIRTPQPPIRSESYFDTEKAPTRRGDLDFVRIRERKSDSPDDSDPAKAQPLMQIAVQKLRSPDSTEMERVEARGLVVLGLREQFDADLSGREQKLQQLERQLLQLKAHVERRKAARDKLVELQVQLMENEALGLAFPAAWQMHAAPTFASGGGLLQDDFPPLDEPASEGRRRPSRATSDDDLTE